MDFLWDLFAWPGKYRDFLAQTLFLIPLFPLLGFLVNAFGRKEISRGASGFVACFAAFFSFAWVLLCFGAMTQPYDAIIRAAGKGLNPLETVLTPQALHWVYGTWLHAGDFQTSFGLYLDPLAGVMALVVTGVGTLIHIYSMGYMGHDRDYARYFAYLNLFLFAMLVLVLGDNLVLMFVGWEGVGLCSYLLIGFWYEDAQKAAAGMKAFIFNRIGDLGFLLGIFVLATVFGTVNYVSTPGQEGRLPSVSGSTRVVPSASGSGKVLLPAGAGLLDYAAGLRHLGGRKANLALGYRARDGGNFDLRATHGKQVFPNRTFGFAIALGCLLLFAGAVGKSAQLPLYAWLPDAMAGPTPVSALIHAATMVTAGVYLVARLHPLFLFSETALAVIAAVGAVTAIFAAFCALTQTDIKKVLAYSTVSQLGYMFLGLGAGAFGLAIFHVVTHAFFKALLFLGAGAVIHALAGEQDLRKMGGLRKKMPVTFWTMLAGALALAGFPFTAGWYSKDAILAEVLAKARHDGGSVYWLLYALGAAAAFFTAFYTFRLISLAFFGKCRVPEEAQARIHEAPPVMTTPLVVLAIFALIGGLLWSHSLPAFLNPSTKEVPEPVHELNLAVTTLAALAGIALALWMYVQANRLPKSEARQGILYRLSLHKCYIEAFYDKVVTAAFSLFAEVLHLLVDVIVIDYLLVGGAAALTRWVGGRVRRLQSGVLNSYAVGILIGAVIVMFKLLRG